MNIISAFFPEYNLDSQPNFLEIGTAIEEILQKDFSDRWIAIRAISLKDHPELNREQLIEKIKKCGTDRYDSSRKGVHHELDDQFNIELHAIAMHITSDSVECPHYAGDRCSTGSSVGELLLDCFDGAKVDRGYPLRIDAILIYSLDALQPAPMTWTKKGPEYTDSSLISVKETSTFQFKDSSNKVNALIGIISIE